MESVLYNHSSRIISGRKSFRAPGGGNYVSVGQTQLMAPNSATVIDEMRTPYVNRWCPDAEIVVELWLDQFGPKAVVVNHGWNIVAFDSVKFPSAVDIGCILGKAGAGARETWRFLTTLHPQGPG